VENESETCLSATLFTTNPIWTCLGSNLCVHGEKPATSRLTNGTVPQACLTNTLYFQRGFVDGADSLRSVNSTFIDSRLSAVYLYCNRPPPGVSAGPVTFLVLPTPAREPRLLYSSDTKGVPCPLLCLMEYTRALTAE
jgi:hypothetical protein